MLVLSRKQDQTISIGENIKLTVVKLQGNSVRIGIQAPRDVRILRGELDEWHELSWEITEVSDDESDSANEEAIESVIVA